MSGRQRLIVFALCALAVACGGRRPPSADTSPADLPDFDELWDFSDPGATEARFREILVRAEAAGDVSYRLQLETQIARCLGLQRRFDEAHRLLDRVEAALEADHPVARLRYLLERGRVFNSSRQQARARPLFEEAWHLARSIGDDALAVDAAHMVAIVETPKEADAWNLEAVQLASRSDDDRARRWLGSLYNNLGWSAFAADAPEQALAWFEKALAERAARDQPDRTRVARWSVARALRALGRVEEALAIQQALATEHAAAGSRDGYVFEELAECHLALGHDHEARTLFARAWTELSQDSWLVENEAERVDRLRRLGGINE